MTIHHPNYLSYEIYEYHGNTTVERIVKKQGKTVKREWLQFDTVEEAMNFFNEFNEI